jgi:cytochrome o ubiquinol oxidase subunit 2
MLNRTLAEPPLVAGFVRLCFAGMLFLALLNAPEITAAQNFMGGIGQLNDFPVVQQSGEVITQYYYPAVPRQYYVPLPQQQYLPPSQSQIGSPTPQPRFAPSGPLYINPNPLPPQQVNIYGKVIVGETMIEDATVGEVIEVPTPSNSATEKDVPNEPANSATASLAGQTDRNTELTSSSPIRSDSFMNPRGPIAEDQKVHLFWVTVLTMVAIVPVFVLLPLILFSYRRGRKTKSNYQPKWDSSSFLELLMWGVPVVLVTVMSARLWHSTHVLDPYEKISSRNPTVNVQVVGLDWKWLFIYPDHGIATVGELALPIDHPASLTLTSDTVMQSFVIPALGGQIYAMPGMQTELNLIADQLGTMEGENTQFNGDGFAGQKFMTHVVPPEEFEAWVEKVKQQGVALDEASYKVLARRTKQRTAVANLRTNSMPAGTIYFTLDDKELFNNIMMRYMNHKPLKDEDQPGSPEYGVSDETQPEVVND